MHLYLIVDTDTNGDNYDLVVTAADPDGAITEWRGYFALDEDQVPDRVFGPLVAGTEPGALAWHTPACQQVAGTQTGED